MKQENNFELNNIDLDAMNQIVEIKDEELKQVTGGARLTMFWDTDPALCDKH